MPAPEALRERTGQAVKATLTDSSVLSVMLQLAVPWQAPVHPPNVAVLPGVAVRVTSVPAANVAEHIEPQLIPAGVLEMMPCPSPAGFTTNRASRGGGMVPLPPQALKARIAAATARMAT